MSKPIKFEIIAKRKNTRGRLAKLKTKHGEILTPAFVVVATNAAIKGALSTEDLKSAKVQVVLGNTYHILIRDKYKIIKKSGGIGRFMNWQGPTMTDSGGYQVFSLGQRIEEGVGKFANYDTILDARERPKANRKKLAKVTDKGVVFYSHTDGKKILLTPQKSIKIQNDIGADIIFAFDEPVSPATNWQYSNIAMERTHRWAIQSLKAHKNKNQAIFGIVQGGIYEDLRKKSAQFLSNLEFHGFGIGGSYYRVGKSELFKELEWSVPYLPERTPKHFLGIGGVEDIIVSIFQGMDTFDCVIPSREARHGRLYAFNFPKNVKARFLKIIRDYLKYNIKLEKTKFYTLVKIRQSKYASKLNPVDKTCDCITCKHYTLAYLHHLYKSQEMLYHRLATIHNIRFYTRLMEYIRDIF